MILKSCLDCTYTTDDMKYCEAYSFDNDPGEIPELIIGCERWKENGL